MYTPRPFNEGFLPEEDRHAIYYAQYGNPKGKVVVSVHGGPGSQSKVGHASRFDLQKYQVVLFDQRGSGKSTPAGKLEDNTTQKLISDMERLRETLQIEQWFVAGSSWGSTLALVYAQSHPNRVQGLLLSAIFLADSIGLDWFERTPDGAAMVFPDVWEERKEALSRFGISNQDIPQQLYEKIVSGTEEEQQKVASLFANWEGNLLSALRETVYITKEEAGEDTVNSAKIFLHYSVHDYFIEADQIMNNLMVIRDIPTMIVHGRHDLICPFEQAWKLHKALPNSELVVAPQSNHLFTPDGEVAKRMAFETVLGRVE